MAKRRIRRKYRGNKIGDKNIHAKKAGRRKSRSGKIYYESRKNRSDMGFWI